MDLPTELIAHGGTGATTLLALMISLKRFLKLEMDTLTSSHSSALTDIKSLIGELRSDMKNTWIAINGSEKSIGILGAKVEFLHAEIVSLRKRQHELGNELARLMGHTPPHGSKRATEED